jgi:hypothetical protein
LFLGVALVSSMVMAAEIEVRPDGAISTLAGAQQAARQAQAKTVVVHAGTYYLPEPLVLTAADTGTEYRAAAGETVVISGGMKLELTWEPYKDGILQAKTPAGLAIDQLFVNGQRQPMARYPNFDPGVLPYGGYAADAFSPQRAARWADPAGGYIHAMHAAHWGGYHYRITGKNAKGEITYEGGWQNNRQMGMHPQHRYVENIFEELDAPGEWYHNAKTGTLYYLPPKNVEPKTAAFEIVRLRNLVEFNGARNVTLRGFVFRHAARTFMDVKEPLLRSDWTIYRGGALLCNGTEDCTIADCELDQLGGNAIFVNNYNRRLHVAGCDIHDTGASAIAFVGDPKAVRNPLFEYNRRQRYADIDKTPGPQTDNYPADCVVEDCLIRHVGAIEKQATGIELSMSMGITVRHCSIYEASRAGINVSEGTFGGHLIEFCDVFDTVRETGDHGSFNSWGRDRFWGLEGAPAAELPQLALLDIVKPNIIRNSRWRCDHGWDVDLDDGSSNYEIYNNLFLNGGLKLREGFHRHVWNNITVNNSLHPHVWFDNSGDRVTGNIWMGAYQPAGGMPRGQWGQEIDRNLFASSEADRAKFAGNGCDAHSRVGNPQFIDPAQGDYRVKETSPALALGFKNFPMDQFGVQKPALKKIARTPELPELQATTSLKTTATHYWQGAKVKDLEGEEFSAFGVSKDSGGVQLLEAPDNALQAGDLIQSVNGQPVKTVAELFRGQDAAAGKPLMIGIVRGQKPSQVRIEAYTFVSIGNGTPTANGVPVKAITTQPATSNEPAASLGDGKLATNYGPVFGNGIGNGKYKTDLGAPVGIAAISTWSYNQNGNRGPQRFVVFGSNAPTDPGWNVANRNTFTPIAEVDTAGPGIDKFQMTTIRMTGKPALGSFRWLVWSVAPVTSQAENTAYQEVQISPAP